MRCGRLHVEFGILDIKVKYLNGKLNSLIWNSRGLNWTYQFGIIGIYIVFKSYRVEVIIKEIHTHTKF